MKNTIITGIMAAAILMAGCGKNPPNSSAAPPPPAPASAKSASSVAPTSGRAMVTKAKSIVLAEFKLDGVALPEALYQLQIAAKQNDPAGKGVNFMIQNPEALASVPKITLALKNVTLKEAVERVAKAAGVGVSGEDFAFVFDPKVK